VSVFLGECRSLARQRATERKIRFVRLTDANLAFAKFLPCVLYVMGTLKARSTLS
jgi:hypothetical protein